MISSAAETGQAAERKQPRETHTPLTLETTVAQGKQPETLHTETVIVSAPSVDLSKWSKYARTYFTRSISSAGTDTRESNRETFEHYKDLLETAGKTVTVNGNTLKIS